MKKHHIIPSLIAGSALLSSCSDKDEAVETSETTFTIHSSSEKKSPDLASESVRSQLIDLWKKEAPDGIELEIVGINEVSANEETKETFFTAQLRGRESASTQWQNSPPTRMKAFYDEGGVLKAEVVISEEEKVEFCQENQLLVQRGIESVRLVNGAKVGDAIPESYIFSSEGPFPAGKPTCPSGGTYIVSPTYLPKGEIMIKCSHNNHAHNSK